MSLLTASSLPQSTHRPVRVRCRPDLRAVKTLHKYDSAVVVKDPVAMKYHRIRPDEYFVLRQLDGRKSLEQIRDLYEQRFAPWKVSTADLNRLLFRFHQSGLTLSDATMQGDRLNIRCITERRKRRLQQLSSILFIRFPGVDPEPLLKRLYPMVRPLMGVMGMMFFVLLCFSAAVVFATHCEQFSAELPSIGDWIRLDSILILAGVIGGTKVAHELGHALTCKHFGGECHEIGPMLLVFTPALYCDTSDSWMLPSRWQRAAVGMAGIGIELVLAAIATFVWVSTAPGLIHSIAMNVMLVCSVSTLLFNANPLLRYDGYYVLSDLCDIANLGQRSRKVLVAHVAKIFFGVDDGPHEQMSAAARFWMPAYALLAVTYRCGLTLLILWFVSLLLRPYGLESLGRLICFLAATGLVFTSLRPVVRSLRNPARRKQIRLNRTAISAVGLVGLFALLFFPLPSGVSASARLLPRQETSIYITTPGLLKSVERLPGETVREGDLIAQLVNPEVELEYIAAKGRLETQERIVESIRRLAIESPEVAIELPAQKAMLEDLREQLKRRETRRAALQIRAAADGTLIAPPRRPVEYGFPLRLVNWTGLPTDAQNKDCLMEPGDELMSIATDENWDAELILSQNEVQRVVVGSRVKVALDSAPEKTFFGRVADISRAQWTELQNAERRDDPRAARGDQPVETSYVVRVQLDAAEEEWVTGAKAFSRIEAKPMSIASRTVRFLSGLFRFR